MENQDISPNNKDQYPFLSDRIQSSFIDLVFIVMMMFVFASWLEKYDNAPDWIRVALFFGLWAVYEPVCTSLGGTLGNYMKGIRVRQHKSSTKKINIFQALLRYVLKTTLGWISFLTMHTNKERRAIHDLAAGSVMIKI